MSKINNKGFTLIELLVVVGIIAILAIAALIAINPLETQRRSRDSARLQDMARLSASVEAFQNDHGLGNATVGTLPATATTIGEGTTRSQDCAQAGNWLGLELCPYLKQVPLDPTNDRGVSTVSDTTATRLDVDPVGYGFAYLDGDYVFCTYLEADKNAELLDDGQIDGDFDTGTDVPNLDCTP